MRLETGVPVGSGLGTSCVAHTMVYSVDRATSKIVVVAVGLPVIALAVHQLGPQGLVLVLLMILRTMSRPRWCFSETFCRDRPSSQSVKISSSSASVTGLVCSGRWAYALCHCQAQGRHGWTALGLAASTRCTASMQGWQPHNEP